MKSSEKQHTECRQSHSPTPEPPGCTPACCHTLPPAFVCLAVIRTYGMGPRCSALFFPSPQASFICSLDYLIIQASDIQSEKPEFDCSLNSEEFASARTEAFSSCRGNISPKEEEMSSLS